METAPLKVLFVCKGNHARSIMAESIMRRLAGDKFTVFSAGSQPRPEISPFAVRLLQSLNHDITALHPKSWNEFAGPDSPELDFVFTLSETAANAVPPAWPGNPMTALWTLPDPAAFEGEDVQKALAFADAYRMLNNRISIFSSLPLATLQGMALQHRLDAIGKDMGRSDLGKREDAA
ncbi:arsenate reductase ArsC [Bosea sp. (in: a-proteobacteria)]|jgi:arsenate reductase|uniref:arsenate reductase ArsC n=1 Tax=Bosea sp. (in: a-proteobacteria) TaxID=1871050 RepID=UPI0027366AC3|nr:arsenate reductase ArsC [Bosea sp. (in: a-proteobacteria)]MDP3258649.1 arsenate reductase ArsC [Bosea sp. (in: a-proteobacteria)]